MFTKKPYIVEIMEAPRGTFQPMLDGTHCDALYTLLDADGFAWPLHAQFRSRKAAEEARDAVRAHIARMDPAVLAALPENNRDAIDE